MARPRKYPDEVTEREIRLVFESGRPISRVAADQTRRLMLREGLQGAKRRGKPSRTTALTSRRHGVLIWSTGSSR